MRLGDRPMHGIAMLLSSLLLMAFLSALVKQVSLSRPLPEILFFRFAASLIPLTLILRRSGGLTVLRTSQPAQHLLRSFFGISGLGLYFYALGTIPIADATALGFSAPMFITIFSIIFLGEQVGLTRWIAVVTGFVGVFLIANPGVHGINLGTIAAVASAVFGGLVSVWIRRLSLKDPVVTIAILYNSAGMLVALAWLLSVGWSLRADLGLVLMIAIGLIAGAQQFLMTSSFRYAEASFLAPFEYVLLVFSAALGWFFFSEVPSANAIIGALIISASGVFIVRRGKKDRA
ncbi:MAG: permease [marine bacterium B5-7]|nr:MAG: permease [marine bacterium B5-7]